MSRLEEIKNRYAKEFDYNDWTSFINDQPSWGVEGHMNDICKRYATQVAQDSLEKARKWDKLDEEIGRFYETDWEELNGSDSEDGDLLDIGEVAARAFGYL